MQALVYLDGICEVVEQNAKLELLHDNLKHADSVSICTVSSVFVLHIGNVALYFSGMTENTVNSLYTSLLAPYSKVGECEDEDLFVSSVQITLQNFANRLAAYLSK